MLSQIALAVGVGVAIALVANLATSVYLHRCLTHRAVALSGPVRAFFRVFLWMSTGIRPRQWVAVHRRHHAFTDMPEDPHSPARLGWQRVLLTNAVLYRDVARDEVTVEKYTKDLPPTKADRYLFAIPWIGPLLGLGLLMLVIGWWQALIAAGVHVVTYIGLGGAVNGIAHTFGRRPYDNSATNVHWIAWLTAGEGFHNNHHAAPTSARFSRRWWELDWGWWFISSARRVGLADVRNDDVDELARRTADRAARADRAETAEAA